MQKKKTIRLRDKGHRMKDDEGERREKGREREKREKIKKKE